MKQEAPTSKAQAVGGGSSLKDCVVGVLYGNTNELSAHYKKINKEYDVLVGNDFWEHLTGNKEFYDKLINAFSEAAIECNSGTKLETVIEELAKNIESQRKRA